LLFCKSRHIVDLNYIFVIIILYRKFTELAIKVIHSFEFHGK